MRSAKLPPKKKARAVACYMVQSCTSKDKPETVGWNEHLLCELFRSLACHLRPAPYWPCNLQYIYYNLRQWHFSIEHWWVHEARLGRQAKTNAEQRACSFPKLASCNLACDIQTASYCHIGTRNFINTIRTTAHNLKIKWSFYSDVKSLQQNGT